MKKYKVIALTVGGRGNKIFKSKDIVTEDQFLPGHIDELVKNGFIAPFEEEIFALEAPKPFVVEPELVPEAYKAEEVLPKLPSVIKPEDIEEKKEESKPVDETPKVKIDSTPKKGKGKNK